MKKIELRRGLVPEQHSATKRRIETIRSGNSEAGVERSDLGRLYP